MAVDHWGRNVGDMHVKNMTERMRKPVQMIKTRSKENEDAAASNRLATAVADLAKKVDANSEAELDQAKSWTNTITNFIKGFKGGQGSKGLGGSDKQTVYLEKIAEATTKLWTASQSQHTIWVGISKLTTNAQKHVANAVRMSGCCGATKNVVSKASMDATHKSNTATAKAMNSVAKQHKNAGGGGSGGGAGAGGDFDMGDGASAAGMKWGLWLGVGAKMLDVFTMMHKKMLQMLDLDPMSIFDGIIADSNNFRENLRSIIHETKGFGDANRDLEDQMNDVLNSAIASGAKMADFQRIYLQNLERGLNLLSKEDKLKMKGVKLEKQEAELLRLQTTRIKSIQTSAINTATMLHMNADALNQMFVDWHMNIGLSALQLGEMGRHMQNIARSTGVTGSSLEKAMKNAEGLVKGLKKSGIASTDAIKNVTEIMTLAEKYGVGEEAGGILSALTGGNSFANADGKTRALLARSLARGGNGANDMVAMRSGALLQDKDGIKRLMTGMSGIATDILGTNEAFLKKAGVIGKNQTVKDIDLTNLSGVIQKLNANGPEGQAMAFSLQRQMEQMGMTIGGFEQTMKVVGEMSKTPFENVQELSQKLNEMHKKGLDNLDEYKRLQQNLMESQTNLGMDAFGRVKEFGDRIAAAGGKIGGQLETDMITALKPVLGASTEDFVKNMGSKSAEFVETLKERAKAEGMDLKKLVGDRGIDVNDLAKGLSTGDEKTLLVLQEAMQQLAKREKVSNDPMMDIRETLKEINATLNNSFLKISSSFGNFTVKVLYFLGLIASAVTELVIAFAAFKVGKALLGGASSVKDVVKSVIGGKGGGPAMPMPTTGAKGGPVVPAGPHSPHYGGTGWSGGNGPLYKNAPLHKDSPLESTKSMSRGDRIKNAESYLAARKAAGQSGKVPSFGGGVTPGYRRFNFGGGKGIKGLFGKALSFGSKHAGKIGALAGAAGGYYASDGDLLATGAGALGGYGAGKFAQGRGLKPSALPELAGLAGDAASMAGMPGWGQNCVPVCIVGGLENMMGMGMGSGGGALDTAASVVDVASMADDVAKMAAKTADKADDVAKAGRLSKFLNKIPGFSKVSGIGGKIAGGIAKVPGLTKGLQFAGKAAGPLGALLGAGFGAMDAEAFGRSKTEGAILGGLTGGVGTGSMFSGLVGAEAGSAADEGIGVLGAAGTGAMTGAAIGSIIPGVGTLVGAGVGALVGASAELYKVFTSSGSALADSIKGWASSLWEGTKDTWEIVKGFGAGLWEGVQNIGSTIASSASWLGSTVMDIGKGLWDGAAAAASSVVEFGGQMLEGAKSAVGEFAGSAVDGVVGIAKGAADSVGGWFSSGWSTVKGWFGGESEALKESATTTVAAAASLVGVQNTGAFDPHSTVAAYDANMYQMLQELNPEEKPTAEDLAKAIQMAGDMGPGRNNYGRMAGTGSLEALKQSQETLSSNKSIKDITSSNKGLFESTQVSDAYDQMMIARMTNQSFGSSVSNEQLDAFRKLAEERNLDVDSNMKNTGLFEDKQVEDALDKAFYEKISATKNSDLNEVVSSAINGKSGSSTKISKSVIAEVSKALDYERSASDAAELTKIGEITSNSMDYNDDLKGEVGTLGVSRAGIESSLERERYEAGTGGGTILPSMEAIGEYLLANNAKMDTMIHLLGAIEGNTRGFNSTDIVGKFGAGVRSPVRPGVKNVAKGHTTGAWDLTFSDYSHGSVTTEGRGGSA